MRQLFVISLAMAFGLASAGNANTPECPMHMTFDKHNAAKSWRAVNDGVMGGQSSGGPVFENGHMIFRGTINTNGGGFSSVRTSLKPGKLAATSGLTLRLKPDGRVYKVTLRTDVRYRGRQISFQGEIPQTPAGEWAEVNVDFADLNASLFGRPVSGANFDSAKVEELGLIIADGRDGPFQIEVDWIKACTK